MNTEEILETFRNMVVTGDREGAEKFITEHFKELPEEIQGDVLLGLLFQAGAQNETRDAAHDVQEDALDLLEAIDDVEKEIEKVDKKQS